MTQPVLHVVGEASDDIYLGTIGAPLGTDSRQVVNDRFPQAREHVLPGVNHLMALADADGVAAAIAGFVRELSAAPSSPTGPVGIALTGAKADERQTLLGIFDAEPELSAWRVGQVVIADKNYYGRGFEAELAGAGLELLRPARKGETERPGARFFKPLRQVIESISDTFKGQLNFEQHGGHTPAGGLGPCRAARPGPDRGDLAQRPDRSADQGSLLAYDH